jgi:hypothetical protein
VMNTRTSVISERKVKFPHAECDLQYHMQYDVETHKFDYDYDFNTHKSDLYPQSVTRMSMITTRTSVIYTRTS